MSSTTSAGAAALPVAGEREAFEAWATRNGFLAAKEADGSHSSPVTHCAWVGWMARAALAPTTPATPVNWRKLLRDSEDNFNRQFGISVAAAWVYRDLEDLLAEVAPTTPVPAEPVAWDVRNAEISYRGVFATEKEARAIADQQDEAGYSQAIVMPLVYPTPAQQTQSDAAAGAVEQGFRAALHLLFSLTDQTMQDDIKDTKLSEEPSDFERGRYFEAKQIARAMSSFSPRDCEELKNFYAATPPQQVPKGALCKPTCV